MALLYGVHASEMEYNIPNWSFCNSELANDEIGTVISDSKRLMVQK